ncbi:MAG: hypothetical protein GY903_07550, partial [Fuerstiella sp.]|nr:hypothetical protein [Fuerstiella sp.]
MGIQLAPIEGTPYAGGTATGIIYLDANGLQRTSSPGPTVDASGNVTVSSDINFSAANPSLQRQGTDYISLSSGLVNLGQNAQSTYLGSGAFGHYGKSWISAPSNGVMSVFAWDGSTLAEVDVGILNATAPAITNTPLTVAGAVGQTADLAAIGDVTIDASSNVTSSGTVKANRVTTTALTAALLNENPSTTNPSIVPHSGVLNTGIGLGPNDGGYALSLIAGSVEGLRVKASGDVTAGGDINVVSNKSVYIAGVQGAYDIGAGSAQFKTNLTYDAILEGYT